MGHFCPFAPTISQCESGKTKSMVIQEIFGGMTENVNDLEAWQRQKE